MKNQDPFDTICVGDDVFYRKTGYITSTKAVVVSITPTMGRSGRFIDVYRVRLTVDGSEVNATRHNLERI